MEKSPVTPTLGTRIAQRRVQLSLSQSAAARAAGVSRSAWIAWENDDNPPADSKYAAIELALRWAPGSVAAIRKGGEPTPAAEPAGEPVDDDPFVRELRAMNLAPKKFAAIVAAYREDLAKEAEHRVREDAAREEKYRRIAQAVSD